MPEPITATAAAIGIGAAGTAYSAREAGKAGKAQAGAAKDQTALQAQRYARFDELYGPLEEQVTEYARNLTPEDQTARGYTAIAEETAKAEKSIAKTLAQRGITGGGAEAGARTSLELTKALSRADVKQRAPQEVAAIQSGILAQGQGLEQSAAAGLSQAYQQQGIAAGQQQKQHLSNISSLSQFAVQAPSMFSSLSGTPGTQIDPATGLTESLAPVTFQG